MRQREAKALARLVFLAACLATAAISRADDNESLASPIEFQVVPERDSFPADQGVWLTVAATNAGREPVTFVWGDYAYEDLFEFEVVRPDGTGIPPPRGRISPPIEALTPRDIVTLASGDRIERTIVLAMMYGGNVQPFRFLYPGTYLIRPRIRLSQVRLVGGEEYFESSAPPIVVTCAEIETTVEAIAPDPTLTFSMTGVVVDSNGDPVANAEIDVEAQYQGFSGFDGVNWMRVDRVATDGRGRFSVEGLDRAVVSHRLLLHHPDHPIKSQEIPTRVNEGIVEIDPIALAEGHVIEGRVTDPEGTPIVGVRVTTGVDREVWTNREGRFRDTGFPTELASLETPPPLQAWKRGWVEAGPPTLEVIDGTAKLHQILIPESQQQVAGVARFADGDPAANRDLYIYRAPSDGYAIETTTDALGRFTVDWPAFPGVTNDGVAAILEPGERHLPRRAWVTEFSDLEAGASNVEFLFDATGELSVDVVPTNELPASKTMTVNVSLKLPGNREQILFTEPLSAGGGNLSWNRMSPGDYLVNVRIDGAEHWNWMQEATIAGSAQAAECRIELPELQFGSGTLKVVTSSGAPWAGDLWMDSSYGWGPVRVFNGEAEINDVPAGPIHIEVHTEGFARTHLHGNIVVGETVDLGTLEALTLDEGTGMVFGRVLLAGGGPALGARVEVAGGTYDLPPHLGGQQVDGDGLFAIRLDPGRKTLRIDVDRSLQPENDPNAVQSDVILFAQRRLQVEVDVVAGGETETEVILPEMSSEVLITGSGVGTAVLHMPLEGDMSYQDTLPIAFGGEQEVVSFHGTPRGLAQVSIARRLPDSLFADTADGYRTVWEHHWIEVDSQHESIELAELEAGRVIARLRNADGTAVEQFLLRAGPASDELPAFVREADPANEIQSSGAYIENGVGILYLAPGRYDISTTHQERVLTQPVEIEAGETAELDFTIPGE
jgi:protocatechuate 3,4-dioxygenase beta subunit